MVVLYACNAHTMQLEWCAPPAHQSWERQGPWIYRSWRDLVYAPLCVSQDGQGYAVVTNVLKNLCGLNIEAWFFIHSTFPMRVRDDLLFGVTQEPKMLGSISQHMLPQSSWQREVGAAVHHTGNHVSGNDSHHFCILFCWPDQVMRPCLTSGS